MTDKNSAASGGQQGNPQDGDRQDRPVKGAEPDSPADGRSQDGAAADVKSGGQNDSGQDVPVHGGAQDSGEQDSGADSSPEDSQVVDVTSENADAGSQKSSGKAAGSRGKGRSGGQGDAGRDEDSGPVVLPLFCLRGMVPTPHTRIQLILTRAVSVAAVEAAGRATEGKYRQALAVFCQKDDSEDQPGPEGLYEIGVVCVLTAYKGTLKGGKQGATMMCLRRARMKKLTAGEGLLRYAEVEFVPDAAVDADREAEMLSMLHSCLEYAEQNAQEAVRPLVEKQVPEAVMRKVLGERSLSQACDLLTQILDLNKEQRILILQQPDPLERARLVIGMLSGFAYRSEIERRILEEARESMERSQKEYFLNEQLRAIKRELGVRSPDHDQEESEIEQLKEKERQLKAPDYVHERLRREIKKLAGSYSGNSEGTIIRNYIDTLFAIPWENASVINRDMRKAQQVLDKDHYGLKKVKDRILEYLAVQAKSDHLHGPILCLVGPPGIGKTSLGESIAHAIGRNFVRVSLGGMHDEAEIRGHRRTYVGSLPGRIVQSLIKSKVNNPLFLLDEIDKVSDSAHGDPGAALLEVLDPEQNRTFSDNYVEIDVDLSDVMFVTTANSYNISAPLMDRMEIIDLSSYTEEEKFHIATEHLIPKQLRFNSLTPAELVIEDAAITELIRYYTHEAGVRGLERLINEICRKTVKDALLAAKNARSARKKIARRTIDVETLHKMLGPRRYDFTSKLKDNKVGLVNGLAWTSLGGDILQLEAVVNEGKGKHQLTGKLGQVMKESISAAVTLVRSMAGMLKLDPGFYERCDLHIHVPEGATPKEGPSAGVGMVTAVVSALTGNPVRADVAMTGEITLRGDILPIGGLKEKLLAALRGGIKTVIIPKENEKDLWDVPENVTTGLEIRFASRIEEVISAALVHDVDTYEPKTVWSSKKAAARSRRRSRGKNAAADDSGSDDTRSGGADGKDTDE